LNPGVTGYGVTDITVTQACLDELAQLDAFSASRAVADGNVYLTDTFLSSTPRCVVLMEYMAKMFHPDLFADLDPQATHQEYLIRFMRIDVSGNGGFE
jgi:iron complex transport system substrate-binding protein